MTIVLGTAPIALPEPLAGLVRELAATRSGHAAIGRPGTSRGCSPADGPAIPSTAGASETGSKNIGLYPRQARATALFTLASQLPAAILARMLGIHIHAAVQWQKAAAAPDRLICARVRSVRCCVAGSGAANCPERSAASQDAVSQAP